jgi:hypothetical protein
MALTSPIPIGRMPVDYLTQGTGAINDILQKARQAALQRQQMEEMAKFHGADLAMREKSLGASHQFDALKKMIFEQQLQGLKNKNDPTYEMKQFQALSQMLGGGDGGGLPDEAMSNQQQMPDSNQMPFGQGQGMFSPQQSPDVMGDMMNGAGESKKQIDLQDIRNNPLLKGFIKHKFGIDMDAQSPDEKEKRALDFNQMKLQQKEEFDKAKELRKINNQLPLTNAMKTQLQNIVTGVPKVTKKIDDLIAAPSPTTLIGFKPDQRAQHASLVLEAAESYAKAKGWPNTNESIKAARDILDRHTLESDDAYRKRLKALKHSLGRDYKDANETLNPVAGIPQQEERQMDISQMSDEELQKIASGG